MKGHEEDQVQFKFITGILMDHQQYVEEHKVTTGGGGYVHKGTGYISGPTTRVVRTEHWLEFWLKERDGKEIKIKTKGRGTKNVSLRDGQEITVIYAARPEKKTETVTTIINHSSKEHWHVKSSGEITNELRIGVITGKSLLIALAIYAGVFFAHDYFATILIDGYHSSQGNGMEWGLYAAVAFLLYRTITKGRRINRLCRSLWSDLEAFVKPLLPT